MPELKLETHENQTTFEPGGVLHGLAGWELEEPPNSVEVRLTWYTEGKGDQDIRVADHQVFDDAPAVDARIFDFAVPDQPYSFSGTLITLRWALELIVDGKHSKRIDLAIAPGGREIDLRNLEAEAEPAT